MFFISTLRATMAVQSISTSRVLLAAVTTLALLVTIASAQAPNQADYLAAHNTARSAVGVAPLVWDDAAYAVAASWSAGCVFDHNANRGDQYGENIAWGTGLTAVGAVDLWVAEEVGYDYASNTCSDTVNTCLHYTQVVWNTTTGVGCASADCGVDGIFHVCDYTPPGNYPGVPPY